MLLSPGCRKSSINCYRHRSACLFNPCQSFFLPIVQVCLHVVPHRHDVHVYQMGIRNVELYILTLPSALFVAEELSHFYMQGLFHIDIVNLETIRQLLWHQVRLRARVQHQTEVQVWTDINHSFPLSQYCQRYSIKRSRIDAFDKGGALPSVTVTSLLMFTGSVAISVLKAYIGGLCWKMKLVGQYLLLHHTSQHNHFPSIIEASWQSLIPHSNTFQLEGFLRRHDCEHCRPLQYLRSFADCTPRTTIRQTLVNFINRRE